MKNVILLFVILFTVSTNAQYGIDWGSDKYFTASIFSNATGTIRDEKIDVGAELEWVSERDYVKIGVQYSPVLKGDSYYTTGAYGLNFKSTPFEDWRGYTGIRFGFIHRDLGRGKATSYGLFGLEAGVDYNINDKFFVGASAIYDYRTDYAHTDERLRWDFSARVRAGIKF